MMTKHQVTGKTWIVYLLVNDITNEEYVGCTSSSLEERLSQHMYGARLYKEDGRPRSKLSTSIAEWGIGNFTLFSLSTHNTRDDGYSAERVEIAKRAPVLNKTKGGGGCLGMKFSAERNAKIASIKKNMPISKEWREKMNAGRWTEEARRARSRFVLGTKHSEETRAKLRAAWVRRKARQTQKEQHP